MQVFISYAREDRDFVRKLHADLVRKRRDVWVDWEDIPPTATWLEEVYAGIEASDIFLLVISPEAVASETCQLEIAHAAKHNKRLICIVRREAPDDVPGVVRAVNWIFFREADDFEANFQLLLQALDTDIEWVHVHTRLLVRALDWEKRSRDASMLLRGRDLRDAEAALAAAGTTRSPSPTAQQLQFVLLSRQAADRRRRITIGAISLGTAAAAILGYVAWTFSQQRDAQRAAASANALTTHAQLVRDRGAKMLPVSLLLALESRRIVPSAEADQLIREGLRMLPRPIGRLAHGAAVKAVAFSPDGRLLATVTEHDPNVRIWDIATQRELHRLRQSPDFNQSIAVAAFTPDGSFLYTGGNDGVTVWDVASGHESRRLVPGTLVTALALSGDGKYLATGHHDGAVIVSDAVSGERVLEGRHGMIVNAVAWSGDGRELASASNDKTARVWQVPGEQVLSLPHEFGPIGIAWSADGKWIATGGWEGRARVWERTTGRERAGFDVKSPIHAVAFGAGGTELLAAVADDTVRVWDLISGTETARMTHDGDVTALAVGPDGRSVATGSADETAALWDLGSGDEVNRLMHPEGIVTAVAYSADGTHVATVADRTVHVWEVPSGAETMRFEHHGRVRALRFSEDGRAVLAAEENSSSETGQSVVVWDMASRQRQRQLAADDGVVSFSDDGRYFATGDFKTGALVRDVESGGAVARITNDAAGRFTSAIALSADHRFLAASVHDGANHYQTYVWHTDGGTQKCHFDHERDVVALTFSSDGTLLAAGGWDNAARVWALDTCRETARFAMTEPVSAVAFSPDGALLATGSRDRTARIWALESKQELGRLTLGGVVNALTFSPDGRFIAAAGSDRSVRVWRWRSDEDAAAAVCARVGRSLTRDEWREYLGDVPYHETCAGLTAIGPHPFQSPRPKL